MPVGARRSVLQGVAGTSTERGASTSWHWGVAAAAVLSVLLRLRFVWTPITSDEGGYLAIARAWRHGAVLYRDVWVDRPQGLIVLNRVWDNLGLGTPAGIRILAILAGVVGVVACASIAKTLFGPVAAVLAALFVAVLSSAPDYEGFIADGELLSGAVGAAGLAVALTAITPMNPRRLYAAGLIGGAAISLKQSGFDAILTAVVVVAATAVLRRDSLRGLAAILSGIVTVLGAMAVYGALTSWDRFWYTFVGYRIAARSIATNPNFDRFGMTWTIAAPIIGPAIAATIACLMATWRGALSARVLTLVVWTAFATVAFAAGGQFHRHYWVILAFPLGTVAAAAISLQPRKWVQLSIASLVVAVPLVHAVRDARLSRDQVAVRLDGDDRLVRDEAVARWYRDVRAPGDSMYVLCASAGFYTDAHVDPPYPYLWYDNVLQVRGAQERLDALFTSPQRPTYVAVYEDAAACNRAGAVEKVLNADYALLERVDGIDIYRVDS